MSNLPFVSNIIENVVDARIEDHLRENDIHEPLQSAYRKHHSTETALIKIQNDIHQALASGRVASLVLLELSAAFDTFEHSILTECLQKTKWVDDWSPVDVIYLDFQKAFDKVPHKRLILKLKSHGMGNSIIKWIEQFLTDMRQRVVVDGEVSGWKSVLSGVHKFLY